MAVAVDQKYASVQEMHRREVQELVIAGLNQIKEGKTKDFNTVCNRLEKKYRDATLQD